LGVSLDTPIALGDAASTVRDLLHDSIQTFDLHEDEIAWTAIAYTLYLAPSTSHWENRDNELTSFDQLARELMARPLSKASCGGAHMLLAMTLLLRADTACHVLSNDCHQQLYDRVRAFEEQAIKRQEKDGAWIDGWYSSSIVRPPYLLTTRSKLLVTGHLLEWMEYLPAELLPPSQNLSSATEWLFQAISEISASGLGHDDICPWTHSVCALRNLAASRMGYRNFDDGRQYDQAAAAR
jgi:hypothetical protein